MMNSERNKQSLIGKVVSTKMEKTATVTSCEAYISPRLQKKN